MKKLIRFSLAALVSVGAYAFIGLPAASAAPGPWWADYFANPNLDGGAVVSRQDAVIGFDWSLGSPHPAVPADNFSVRWTREEWFDGGTFRFMARSDDGIRLRVGEELIIDEWYERQGNWTFVDHYVAQGNHTVVVEYFERTGAAAVQVGWERVAAGATWRGEYYDNRKLKGTPVLVRNDGAIDFDWGAGSPDPAVPVDNFSVRWTRTLGFTAGTYRFLASCDDGVRVYVNGQLVIDAWQKQQLPNTASGDITPVSYTHLTLPTIYSV